jgi:hypothetical protein
MRIVRTLPLLAFAAALVTVFPVQDAHAQRRPAVRRAVAPRPGGVVVGAYYRPLFLSPFYDPFWDPWWYPYPFGWYPPFAYGAVAEDAASLRLQVSPRETEVYIDGYYAGTVDDFDGMFQHLNLQRGEHDVTLYLEGHRTVRQKIFLQDGGTFRIRHTMEALAAGETGEPRPVAVPRPDAAARGAAVSAAPESSIRGDANFGAIAIRVQPADAEILIDGERWQGPQTDESLVIQVAPGAHRVEARKDGYRSYMAEVDVTAAQTSPINISLPRQ